jgi:MFS family permease
MFAAQALPYLFFGAVAGVFVDRWDRKRIMTIAGVLRTTLVLLLLLVTSAASVWLIYVVAFCQASISLFFGPAENALLPKLVGEEHLTAANFLNAINDNIPRLIGPPIGGALLVYLGLPSVALLSSACFLISSIMIAQIAISTHGAQGMTGTNPSAPGVAWLHLWQEWRAGLRVVIRERTVAVVFGAIGMASIGDGIFTVLLVVFVDHVLQKGAWAYGWVLTARGVGGLVGSFIIGQFAPHVPPMQLLAGGLLGSGLLVLAMANVPLLPLTLVLMACIGITVIAWVVSTRTILQIHVRDTYHGRVFSAYGTTNELLALAAIGLTSVLGEMLSITTLLSIGGMFYIFGAIVSAIALPQVKK